MIRFIPLPNGKIVAKTKMGLTNDQTKMAQKILDSDPNLKSFVEKTLDNNLAAIFELVSPFNQIVLNYEETKLLLLQLRDENTGEYFNIYDHHLADEFGVPRVQSEALETLEHYMNEAEKIEGREGWIFSLKDHDGKLMLVKGKTKWYFDRHGILTEDLVRENRIIKLILEEQIDDAFSMIGENDPRRLYSHEIKETLTSYAKKSEKEILELLSKYKGDRKEFALAHKKHPWFGVSVRSVESKNPQEEIWPILKKLLLEKTYRLQGARSFLRQQGFKPQGVLLGDET